MQIIEHKRYGGYQAESEFFDPPSEASFEEFLEHHRNEFPIYSQIGDHKITTYDASIILLKENPGTYFFRPSSTQPGYISLSFVNSEGEPKHRRLRMVKEEDNLLVIPEDVNSIFNEQVISLRMYVEDLSRRLLNDSIKLIPLTIEDSQKCLEEINEKTSEESQKCDYLLARVYEIKRLSYFLSINEAEAEKKLKNLNLGTFLIRPSNHIDALFALSVIGKEGNIEHIRFSIDKLGRIIFGDKAYPLFLR